MSKELIDVIEKACMEYLVPQIIDMFKSDGHIHRFALAYVTNRTSPVIIPWKGESPKEFGTKVTEVEIALDAYGTSLVSEMEIKGKRLIVITVEAGPEVRIIESVVEDTPEGPMPTVFVSSSHEEAIERWT